MCSVVCMLCPLCLKRSPVPSLIPHLIVQSLSRVQLFVTPWTAAHQASLSFTNSQSLLKLMSIESVMPSNHLILCHPLLLLPSIFPSIRVFPNESVLHIRWPKYWSFSFRIIPSSEYSRLISFRMDWLISLQSKGLSRAFSSTTAFSTWLTPNPPAGLKASLTHISSNKGTFHHIPSITSTLVTWFFICKMLKQQRPVG